MEKIDREIYSYIYDGEDNSRSLIEILAHIDASVQEIHDSLSSLVRVSLITETPTIRGNTIFSACMYDSIYPNIHKDMYIGTHIDTITDISTSTSEVHVDKNGRGYVGIWSRPSDDARKMRDPYYNITCTSDNSGYTNDSE